MQDDISTSLPLRKRALVAVRRFVSRTQVNFLLAIVRFGGAYVTRLVWNWNHRSYACALNVSCTSVNLYVV